MEVRDHERYGRAPPPSPPWRRCSLTPTGRTSPHRAAGDHAIRPCTASISGGRCRSGGLAATRGRAERGEVADPLELVGMQLARRPRPGEEHRAGRTTACRARGAGASARRPRSGARAEQRAGTQQEARARSRAVPGSAHVEAEGRHDEQHGDVATRAGSSIASCATSTRRADRGGREPTQDAPLPVCRSGPAVRMHSAEHGHESDHDGQHRVDDPLAAAVRARRCRKAGTLPRNHEQEHHGKTNANRSTHRVAQESRNSHSQQVSAFIACCLVSATKASSRLAWSTRRSSGDDCWRASTAITACSSVAGAGHNRSVSPEWSSA